MKTAQKLVLIPLEKWEKLKVSQNLKDAFQTVEVPSQQEKIEEEEAGGKTQKEDTPPTLTEVTKRKKDQNTTEVTKKRKKDQDTTEKTKIVLLRSEHFPPEKRLLVSQILKFLNKSKKIGYNEKMEMVFRDKVVKGSNLKTLIEHAMSNTANNKMKGILTFYRALASISIPKYLIKNKWGLQLMNKINKKK